MRVKTDQLADMRQLVSEINHHAPDLPTDTRTPWEKLKILLRLVFSPEIYEELAQEFQAEADTLQSQRVTPEYSHGPETPAPSLPSES